MNPKSDVSAPVLELDEFGGALIGHAMPTPTSGRVAVYDYDAMVALVIARTGCSRNEAEWHIHSRYLERYLGTASPIFCKREEFENG